MEGLICEDKLPETQSAVVTALVKDIKWILSDEIAFAMIRSPGGIEVQRITFEFGGLHFNGRAWSRSFPAASSSASLANDGPFLSRLGVPFVDTREV